MMKKVRQFFSDLVDKGKLIEESRNQRRIIVKLCAQCSQAQDMVIALVDNTDPEAVQAAIKRAKGWREQNGTIQRKREMDRN